jgi:dTMP kinase
MPVGSFITFEGGEGSGKSTQARLLASHLRAHRLEVTLTREPGGTPVAERIRELILAEKPHAPVAEFLLFAAARAEHLHTTIAPALARGAIVICDRFIDSTRVYQSDLGSVDPKLVRDLEQRTVTPYFPSLTLVLDVPAASAMQRAAQRGDLNRYDSRDLAWHEALRAAFQQVVHREPERCVMVDGTRDEATIAANIRALVTQRLGLGVA